MIDYRQAQQLLLEKARSFGRERIGLEEADGRVLAEPVFADRDYPPFHRSTMDGYAIRHSDLEKGIRRFSVVETIYAGQAGTRSIGIGECYKIMTGAPVPGDADTVIRREDTDETAPFQERSPTIELASSITLLSGQRYQNIARQGEDLRAGDTAIATPSIIGPAVMGILASLGRNECLVEKRPRVALYTTGNEVVQVDAAVSPIQIRNSNRWILQSLLKGWGIRPAVYEHLPDSKEALRFSLGKGLADAELIILSGGVSAGDADYVPGVLEELGVQRLFHKIAMKPGKPVWCGTTPGGAMVFALPGNPFSGMVGFVLLIRHYLHACFGLPAPVPMGLPLEAARKKKTPLDEFFPVRFTGSPANLQTIELNGSGDSRLGLYANALALHPAGSGDLPEGSNTLYYPL